MKEAYSPANDAGRLTGMIFDIKRFAVHDGPGIRTTVFLKGCPLHCAWCHNPEALKAGPELTMISSKCIGCGACVAACTYRAREINGRGELLYHRELCRVCGECVKVCYADALEMKGTETTVEYVMQKLLEDKAFYEQSGGGVTLSGGEPLLQRDFVLALLKRCKSEGFHTAVDTCGQVGWDVFEAVIPYVDLFLYDLKHAEPKNHRKWTGVSNRKILENLHKLDERRIPIEIRMPIIPTINDSDDVIDSASRLLASIKSITAVRLLPYHSYAGSKYERLGMKNTMPQVDSPTKAHIDAIADRMRAYGLTVI